MTLNYRAGGFLGACLSHLNFQEHHHALRNVLAGTDVWSLWLYLFHFRDNINYQVKLSKVLFSLEPPK